MYDSSLPSDVYARAVLVLEARNRVGGRNLDHPLSGKGVVGAVRSARQVAQDALDDL
jgi:hypothetical protein